jgi:hypothetical protein
MAQPHRTEEFARTEGALIILFCLVDDSTSGSTPEEAATRA